MCFVIVHMIIVIVCLASAFARSLFVSGPLFRFEGDGRQTGGRQEGDRRDTGGSQEGAIHLLLMCYSCCCLCLVLLNDYLGGSHLST